jgi:hypothetical protein
LLNAFAFFDTILNTGKQNIKSKEAQQRLQRHMNWQRPGARPIPVVFAKAPVKRTSVAQQRAADLRRSQGRHPINMTRAASMRPSSAYGKLLCFFSVFFIFFG